MKLEGNSNTQKIHVDVLFDWTFHRLTIKDWKYLNIYLTDFCQTNYQCKPHNQLLFQSNQYLSIDKILKSWGERYVNLIFLTHLSVGRYYSSIRKLITLPASWVHACAMNWQFDLSIKSNYFQPVIATLIRRRNDGTIYGCCYVLPVLNFWLYLRIIIDSITTYIYGNW